MAIIDVVYWHAIKEYSFVFINKSPRTLEGIKSSATTLLSALNSQYQWVYGYYEWIFT